MRFDRLAVHNIGPFADVDIDLTTVNGPIVAVAGENGAGKTTLLELLAAALYRECPTRGKLMELATDRDAFIEAAVVNGSAYTLRHVVDMVSRKGESHVLDALGSPLLDAAQRREMDAWAVAHLPAPEVYFSTLFSAQGAGGFLAAKHGERKAILLRALGIEHYEQLAKAAREHSRVAETSALVLRGRLGDVEAVVATVETLEAEEVDADARVVGMGDRLAELRDTAARYDAAVATRRTLAEREEALVGLEARLRKAETGAMGIDAMRDAAEKDRQLAQQESEAAAEAARARAAFEAAEAEAEHAKREHEEVSAQLADAVERATNNRNLLGQADEVRAAVARDAELAAAEVETQRRADAADADHRRLRGEVDALRRQIDQARGRAQVAKLRVEAADRTLAECAGWDDAEAALPSLREALATAEALATEADAEVQAIEAAWRTSSADRISGLRDGLTEIANGTDDPSGAACDVLFHDDRAAGAERDRPAELAGAKNRRDLLGRDRVAAKWAVDDAEKRAALRDRAEDARNTRADALAELTEAEEHGGSLTADKMSAEKGSEEAATALQAARIVAQEIGAERSRLVRLVRRAAPLQDAESRLAELQRQIEQLHLRETTAAAAVVAATKRLEAADANVGPVDGYVAIQRERATLAPLVAGLRDAEAAAAALVELRDRVNHLEDEVAALRRQVADAPTERPDVESFEQALRQAEGALAATRERLARAREAETQARTLRDELAAVEEERADWTRLGADLGRDGLQALEVDAAGPEISAMANDLLHTCFGPRWTVELVTTRQSADGKKEIETCDVLVTDTERARIARVETLSGGEAVIVGEALSLALTVVATRRMGVDRPTLIRDESGAALDAEKTRAWVRMLRRAAEMTGADKVLVVSHNPEVREMADSVLWVADGHVEVR